MGKTGLSSAKQQQQQKMKSIVIILILLGVSLGVPVDIPKINDLPSLDPYQPEKPPNVPIKLGHRRCDNIYHEAILPCLLRPELPPFSYSTERYYNIEYKKK